MQIQLLMTGSELMRGTTTDTNSVRIADALATHGLAVQRKVTVGDDLDLLVHDIDQAISLCGVPPSVAAKSLGSIDTVSATFLYPDGPEVRVQGGWFEPGTPFSMSFQVIAELAQLELSSGKLRLSDASGNAIEPELPTEDAYEAQIQYFVDCAISGKYPDRCPPEQSASAVKVANAMEKSRSADGERTSCQQ